jgi:hypothetical protein
MPKSGIVNVSPTSLLTPENIGSATKKSGHCRALRQ